MARAEIRPNPGVPSGSGSMMGSLASHTPLLS
ncbi:MAG: hypothetical protein CM1200mP32_02410 [Methanobacteriota archaeon]|nr:MAG: hypothetical protein CM1200mP32_02410 [Euryarchaeota archaeon]